jgi:hypothetical protein
MVLAFCKHAAQMTAVFEGRNTNLIMLRQRLVMLPPYLGPLGEVILRGRGRHFAFQADNFAAESRLFLY